MPEPFSSDRSGDSRCSACQRRRQSATRHAFRDNGPVAVVMEILAEVVLDRIGIVVANNSARSRTYGVRVKP